jgi:hypothetical protein
MKQKNCKLNVSFGKKSFKLNDSSRKERRQTGHELREKQLQTEDLRQKHVGELHELEIKERILKIHYLKERLRKN